MAQKRLRLLCCLLLASLFALPSGYAQQRSPYKNLRTAISTAVYDTISGIDLDVNESSPQPQHGDLNISVIAPGGSGTPYVFEVQYTPDPGFVGVDSFVLEYRYASTYPFLIYRGFRVSVLPSMVKAHTDFAVTAAGTAVTLNVLANDEGAWGPLSVAATPLVKNGTTSINANNEIVFTPDPGFLGVAHVSYTVCDALNTCQRGFAHIGVHGTIPVEDTIKVFTNKNQALKIPLTYDGYTMFQGPANGLVDLIAGKSFCYTPNAGFSGTDHFVLKTTVNGVDYLKTVDVKVFNTQSPNLMAMDDLRFTPKGQPITFNVRDNDIGNLLVRHWTLPANFPGTLTNTNGTGNVTFTPNAGFTGVATFTYKIGNSSATALETATVTIVVDNLSLPEGSFPYVLNTPVETPLVLHYEIPYENFSFVIAQNPQHGAVAYYPGFSTQTVNGQTVSGNNLVVYTPEEDYVGAEDFSLLYCAPNGECVFDKIILEVVEIDASEPPFCVTACAWPGDANADGLTNNRDLLSLGYALGQDGPARVDGSATWYGQYADNWEDPFSDLPQDTKHLDGDGNGTINELDIHAIHDNYNKANNLFPKAFQTGKGLPFSLELLTGPIVPGEPVQILVSLGTESVPAIDVYGFTFDVTLGQGLVDSAFKMTFFDNSWLNLDAPGISLAERPYTGRFETAFSRTNGMPVSGIGSIGMLEIVIVDIIEGGGQDSRNTLTLNPSIMLAEGNSTTGAPIILELPVKPGSRSIDSSDLNEAVALSVFPSPARESVQVSWSAATTMEQLTLLDVHGKTLQTRQNLSGNQVLLDVSGLPTGVYLIRANTEDGVVSKKVQVIR